MKSIKLVKGLATVYRLDSKGYIFEEITQKQYPYFQQENGSVKCYALCPICEQPVRINGYLKADAKRDVYASHAGKSVKGLATNNILAMKECESYIGNSVDRSSENILTIKDIRTQKALDLIKNHYDIILYMIEKETGLYISNKMAEELLQKYLSNQAWNFRDVRENNLPWILLQTILSPSLNNLMVRKDSELYDCLKQNKQVQLVATDRIKNCYFIRNVGNENLILHFCNLTYNKSKEQEEMQMRIERLYDPTKETYDRKKIVKKVFNLKLDINYFVKLCNYDKWQPNQKKLDIAKRVLSNYCAA